MKEEISYDYQSDAHFAELKNVEIMKERLAILSDIDGYVGKYFSVNYIRTNILRQSEDDIKQMDEEMEEDKAKMDEEGISAEDLPPPPPPAPAPQQLVVSVKKEEAETRIIDDADQKELARSMTTLFEQMIENSKSDKESE
jgi:hypothetical protein